MEPLTNTDYQTTIGDIRVAVPFELWNYDLFSNPSQVTFYGTNKATGILYIQFESGQGYIYPNCSDKLLTDVKNAKYISSFVRTELTGLKYYKVDYTITVL